MLRTDLSKSRKKPSALCVSDIPHSNHHRWRPATQSPLCLVAVKGETAVRGGVVPASYVFDTTNHFDFVG